MSQYFRHRTLLKTYQNEELDGKHNPNAWWSYLIPGQRMTRRDQQALENASLIREIINALEYLDSEYHQKMVDTHENT